MISTWTWSPGHPRPTTPPSPITTPGRTKARSRFTLPTDVQQIAIQGGPGNDKIQVDPSVYRDVTIVGGEGNDTLIAGSGNDVLAGGPGNNLLAGGSGNAATSSIREPRGHQTNPDTMVGGAGFDTMLGGNGNELMLADDSTARAGILVAGGRHGPAELRRFTHAPAQPPG